MRRQTAATAAIVLSMVSPPAPAQTPEPDALPVAATFRDRGDRRAAFKEPRVGQAIQAGIGWLVAHQEENGSWDCDGFMKHDQGPRSTGAGGATHDVGVTGLALLALLAQDDAAYEAAVENAASWLAKQQDQVTGLVGGNASEDFVYGHAIAAQALAEVAALRPTARWRRCATAAIGYLERHRNPYAAWRYQPRDNDNDTSVTSWCLCAYAAAHHAGIEVPVASIATVLGWLDLVTDPSTGRVGYTKPNEPSSRHPGDHGTRYPIQNGEAMTAAAWHARCLLGQGLSGAGSGAPGPEAKAAEMAADLMSFHLPKPGRENYDLYYWFHASQAAPHLGSTFANRWQAMLQKVLLGYQRRDGAAAGSWDPDDVWGVDGGRVATTALALLSLQAPYRHAGLDAAAQIPDVPPFRRMYATWPRRRFADFDKALREVAGTADLPAEQRAVLAAARWQLELECARANAQLPPMGTQDLYFDYVNHSEAAERIAEEFGDLEVGRRARADLERFKTDPKFAAELAAGKRLRDLGRKYERSDQRQRQLLREQLEKLMNQWPTTSAAKRARDLLALPK